MNVSMDGLRRNLTREFTELTEMIESISADIKNDKVYRLGERLNDLAAQHDQVAQNIGILNCIYDGEDESFTDQSEVLKVRFLGED